MRVAVVGAGPSGIYCAEALATLHEVEVDIFEKLPVPFGLVRYGVAPDHFSIRSVRDKLVETLENPLVRFRGNVSIGQDITTDELSQWYDAVIYSYGASADRLLGIPGEEVEQSIAATDFVKWYTGHPEASDFAEFLASSSSIAVIGLGNVAVDVARLLLKPVEDLSATDMPEHVLEALSASAVTDVHIIGRRGPQHATFTTKELKELGEISGTAVLVGASDMPTDDAEASAGNRVVERNLKVLREWLESPPQGTRKRLHFHFYSTPIAYDAGSHVLEVERMELQPDLSIGGTGEILSISADAVIRSVGYRGTEMSGLPFDHTSNVIPSAEGKVDSLKNSFVAGWIKRGPSGIIGTNKKDAAATVETLMKTHMALRSNSATSVKSAEQVDQLLRERGIKFIDIEGWKRIDAAERELGSSRSRERTTIHDQQRLLELGLGI